jgi:hypothetical protein
VLVGSTEPSRSELPAWLSASQAHRLEGVAVYLGSLWLLSFGVSRVFAEGADVRRTALLPLLLYLGMTLLVPLASGAQARPGFWPHAGAVLLAATALALAPSASRLRDVDVPELVVEWSEARAVKLLARRLGVPHRSHQERQGHPHRRAPEPPTSRQRVRCR